MSYLINTVAKTYRRRLSRAVIAIAGAVAAAVIAPQPNSQVSAQTETGSVVLSPTDTYININSNNYITEAMLATYTWPDYQPANAILMKFDLSKLPAGAVIQSAKLRLSLVEADQKGNTPIYNISAHKIIGGNPDLATATGYMRTASSPWTASNCCWSGVPLAQSNITPAYTTVAVDKTLGVKTWNITTIVQEWMANPGSNFGLLLNSDATVRQNRYRYFASMESSDPALRPRLEVTFSGVTATPPTVSVTSPTSGAVLSGTVSVTASAQSASGIAGVQFRVNGNPLGQEDQSAPYTVSWNTTTVSDGAYTLTAVARDPSGTTATSAGVNVTVKNAVTTAPITIVPTDTSISLDPNNKSTETILTTYTWPEYQTANAILMRFDLSAIPAGATVQDATLSMGLVQSDSGPEATYTVTAHKILNKTPSIGGATGYTYDGTNAWSPSGCCYSGIPLAQADITTPYDQQAIDKTLGVKTWNLTRMVQEWIATPSSNRGLLLNSDVTKTKDRYRFFASTRNSNASLRPVLTVRLGSGSGSGGGGGTLPGDTIAPTVSMTAPASGATVSGSSVTVSANASDNVGVVGVQFKLDGANLGSEDLTAPYSTTWNTTNTANGSHTLSAVARDAAGNVGTSAVVTINVSNTTTPSTPSGGISTLYPGDVGIENDPSVIFVEQFEEGSIANIAPRWGDVKNPSGMQLVTEVPPGSPAGHSLSIPWVGGGVNNGGHLYKMLNPGINDVMYVRYYIKYPTSGDYSHTGVWVGGSNPMSAWPDPIAGSKPSGNDRFIAAGEQNTITRAFEHYNYWMGMHPDAGGTYWGNFLLNNPSVQANPGQWVCVEQMVKMNNPVSAWNGEHALWLNGVKVSHLGQGFPKGYWVGGRFYQDPTVTTTFEGFQWRNDPALNINWLWLQNYAPNDPPGFSSTILFDHVVVAKSRIGCLP